MRFLTSRIALAGLLVVGLAACWSPKAEDSAPRTQDSDDGKTKLRPQDFINLFLAETFINRSRGED